MIESAIKDVKMPSRRAGNRILQHITQTSAFMTIKEKNATLNKYKHE